MDPQPADLSDLSDVSDSDFLRDFSAMVVHLSLRPHLLRECRTVLQNILAAQLKSNASSVRTNTASSQGFSSSSSILSSSTDNTHTSASQSFTSDIDRRLADPTSTSLRSNRRRKPKKKTEKLICTLCVEVGIDDKTFGEKADWKRHILNFHETGMEWRCSFEGCTDSFARESDYFKHHDKSHRSLSLNYTSRELPTKLAHPCGYSNCHSIASTWGQWCDHVAKCTHCDTAWEYSNRMRALLKQPAIRKIWKAERNRVCQQKGINHRDLVWYPETSRKFFEKLQCDKLSSLPTKLFGDIAMLGLPQGSQALLGEVQSEATANYSSTLEDPELPAASSDFQHWDLPSPILSSWHGQVPASGVSSLEPPAMAETSTQAQNRYSFAMPDAPPQVQEHDGEGTMNFGMAQSGLDHITSNAFPVYLSASENLEFIGHGITEGNVGPDLTTSTSPMNTFNARDTSWLDDTGSISPVPSRTLPLNFARPFLPLQ